MCEKSVEVQPLCQDCEAAAGGSILLLRWSGLEEGKCEA